MKEKLEEKKSWITPEAIDLDIEESGKISTEAESGGFGKGS